MSLAYRETTDGIAPKDLEGFFVGWPVPPSPETHLSILDGSDLIVLAVSQDGRVAGFVTVITDGVSCAHIPYLEVLPAWQRQGIGAELMRRMLTRLKAFYAIDLICDDEARGFYERLGFEPGQGMLIRNRSIQIE